MVYTNAINKNFMFFKINLTFMLQIDFINFNIKIDELFFCLILNK